MAEHMGSKFFVGLVLLGVLATIMSTVSSQLMVTSSSFSRDLYNTIFRKHASSGELLWVSRLTVLMVSILAVMLALKSDHLILDIVAYAWAGFGACLGPALLLSLFYRRTTEKGVLAGIIMGGISVLIFKKYPFFGLYEIVPAFALSLSSIIVVSLIDRVPNADVLKKFDLAKAKTNKRIEI
jgi:sodium/proline symporter